MVNLAEYEAALEEYLLVKNQSNPYFNNSIGNVYKHLTNNQQAEIHFRKEIDFMETLVQQGKYQWDGINGVYKYVGP